MSTQEKIEQILTTTAKLTLEKKKVDTKFRVILAAMFRKDHYKLAAISQLSKLEANGDAILDLSRSLLEDMINMEYMLVKGKNEYASKFEGFDAIEQKIDKDFLEANGISIPGKQAKKIEFSYKDSLINYQRPNGDRFKNWAGCDIESMINSIVKKKVINKTEKELLLHAYIEGNRQNHLSPHSTKFYLTQQSIDVRQKSSYEMGLGLALNCFSRVASQLATEIGDDKINQKITALFKN